MFSTGVALIRKIQRKLENPFFISIRIILLQLCLTVICVLFYDLCNCLLVSLFSIHNTSKKKFFSVQILNFHQSSINTCDSVVFRAEFLCSKNVKLRRFNQGPCRVICLCCFSEVSLSGFESLDVVFMIWCFSVLRMCY